MKVSVIIPTYNRDWSVCRAVDSVLRQTYKELELIVVDDGSTDRTAEVLNQFKDSRITVLKQKNQGVAAARNTGVKNSSGEFIAFLDSDDSWKEEKLARHLAFMLEGDWQISQTDEIWIRNQVRVNQKLKHYKQAGWIFEPSLDLCLVSPSCVMLTRQCWNKGGPFDESLLACEDYDLWLRYSLLFPIGFLPERLVYKYGGSADQLSRKIIGLDLYRVYSMLNLLKKQNLSLEKKDKIKKKLELKGQLYIQGCLKRGKTEEALRIRQLIKDRLE